MNIANLSSKDLKLIDNVILKIYALGSKEFYIQDFLSLCLGNS